MKGIERLALRPDADGVVVPVKVVPAASRDKVAGILGDALKITTTAPPEKGKANAAVARTLSKALGVDRRDVELTSGPTNPRKEFRIRGADAQQVRDVLARLR